MLGFNCRCSFRHPDSSIRSPITVMQARLDVALLGGILGSASAGVFPGPALLAWLRRRFTLQEASIVGLQRSLQVSVQASALTGRFQILGSILTVSLGGVCHCIGCAGDAARMLMAEPAWVAVRRLWAGAHPVSRLQASQRGTGAGSQVPDRHQGVLSLCRWPASRTSGAPRCRQRQPRW